jgi:hypothetical protein
MLKEGVLREGVHRERQYPRVHALQKACNFLHFVQELPSNSQGFSLGRTLGSLCPHKSSLGWVCVPRRLVKTIAMTCFYHFHHSIVAKIIGQYFGSPENRSRHGSY